MALVPLPLEFHLKVGQVGASVALFAAGVLGRARRWSGAQGSAAPGREQPPQPCQCAPVRPRADLTGVPRGPVAAAETDLRTCVSELASDLASRLGSESQGSGGMAHRS
ncbi:hypothetical protein AB0M68_23275 [Streptomyces sp. NPDC051453]|uniref:hypothetical protein n=1 Tax=unclassified Streptomyces TaxID=2593676 RepID=UPI002E80C423|nr:hypothetical protein [Streptomyces sp. NBC_00569]WUB92832.1 hypothetical protein OHO83_11320 [Streptomyces sp. NBC_00569]